MFLPIHWGFLESNWAQPRFESSSISHPRPVSWAITVFNIEINGFYACEPWQSKDDLWNVLHSLLSFPQLLFSPFLQIPWLRKMTFPLIMCSVFICITVGISYLSNVPIKVLTLSFWHTYHPLVPQILIRHQFQKKRGCGYWKKKNSNQRN